MSKDVARYALRPGNREEEYWGEEVGHGQGSYQTIRGSARRDALVDDHDDDTIANDPEKGGDGLEDDPPRPHQRVPLPPLTRWITHLVHHIGVFQDVHRRPRHLDVVSRIHHWFVSGLSQRFRRWNNHNN